MSFPKRRRIKSRIHVISQLCTACEQALARMSGLHAGPPGRYGFAAFWTAATCRRFGIFRPAAAFKRFNPRGEKGCVRKSESGDKSHALHSFGLRGLVTALVFSAASRFPSVRTRAIGLQPARRRENAARSVRVCYQHRAATGTFCPTPPAMRWDWKAAGSVERGIHRARGAKAGRKPRLLFRFSTLLRLRCADRPFTGGLFQLPPRFTRFEALSRSPRSL